ncbi:hypothetical protein BDQ12DRAFT_683225 [Crucibulum laeve]|uniref:Uncharacterized protein n=1 Tax=Crucibulum laeve TaxID=68775 RepID=A0A5C3M3F9_9AGAR|nr:hypothetical protein BDQ12DRAFT_683225 [Crucibulum laeve]
MVALRLDAVRESRSCPFIPPSIRPFLSLSVLAPFLQLAASRFHPPNPSSLRSLCHPIYSSTLTPSNPPLQCIRGPIHPFNRPALQLLLQHTYRAQILSSSNLRLYEPRVSLKDYTASRPSS